MVKSVPRTRGDEPTYFPGLPEAAVSSPHARG